MRAKSKVEIEELWIIFINFVFVLMKKKEIFARSFVCLNFWEYNSFISTISLTLFSLPRPRVFAVYHQSWSQYTSKWSGSEVNEFQMCMKMKWKQGYGLVKYEFSFFFVTEIMSERLIINSKSYVRSENRAHKNKPSRNRLGKCIRTETSSISLVSFLMGSGIGVSVFRVFGGGFETSSNTSF